MITDQELVQPSKDVKYRAVMICDLTNPTSLQYSKIARKTFESTSKINIELWQCFTPDTRIDSPFKINWAEYDERNKYKKRNILRKIPDQEKACFESHFYWWNHIAETNEQVIIMEHDAYCRNISSFNHFVDNIPDYTLWNCGLAMECYTMAPSFARYLVKVLKFKIVSGGPMGELFSNVERFFHLRKHTNQLNKLTLWPSGKHLRHRESGKIVHATRAALNPADCLRVENDRLQEAPVTQCYINTLGNTIDHGDLKSVYENNIFLEHLDYV